MFRNNVKTVVLLTALAALFMGVGSFFGQGGFIIGLVLGLVFVGGSYWFSDKIAVRAAGAVPVSEADAPQLYAIVRDLTQRARHADAGGLHQPGVPAERVRDRPQPGARGGRGDAGPAAGRRPGGAARRARPRALARAQPRHPHRVGRRRGGARDHVPRPHADVGRDLRRDGRREQPRPRRRQHLRPDRDDDLRPDGGGAAADVALAVARVRGRPQRRGAAGHRRAARPRAREDRRVRASRSR